MHHHAIGVLLLFASATLLHSSAAGIQASLPDWNLLLRMQESCTGKLATEHRWHDGAFEPRGARKCREATKRVRILIGDDRERLRYKVRAASLAKKRPISGATIQRGK